jgi:hypothetical protein
MIDLLYQHLAIPETCHLGKRVFKKLFIENAQLGITDKKAFQDDIETVTWQYTLKPNTIQIQSYEDDEREYLEVALLEVELRDARRHKRIAEVIHRAVPYPVILVFNQKSEIEDQKWLLSLAHKRFSLSEREKIIADEFVSVQPA